MLKNLKGMSFFCATALAVALSSCSDESPWVGSDSEGGINLQFSTDGRVMRQTRADDADYICPGTPEADQFTIALNNADGSVSRTWTSVEAFNREGSFPIGNYNLQAYYGDIDQEGFGLPYFFGQTTVHVSPAQEAQASITATLANAMVSIRYSEAFNTNFPSHSAAVQTPGHDRVVFEQSEDRPAFIAPADEVNLFITLTDTEGRQVTVQPAGFQALPRHHYIVNVGVDGSSGDLFLDVQFEENVVSEVVKVSLGDDLFTSQPPVITPKGFTDGQTIEGFEFLTQLPAAEFQVFALGGLREANLNFITDGSFTPSFGKKVQLVNASASVQSDLAQSGIVCSGFFRNVDKMGVVNISDFLASLPTGTHTIELTATDALTRVCEPVRLTLNLKAVQYDFADPETILFGSVEVPVEINTNCPDIKEKFTFMAPDANNRMVEVTVKSVTEVTPAKGTLGHTYRYVLNVAAQTGSKVDVWADFNGNRIRTEMPVVLPEYNVEADAFAKHVVLRITCENGNPQNIIDRLTFVNNGQEIPSQNISYDTENHYVIIRGLSPETTYSGFAAKFGDDAKAIESFKTEAIATLPNGDFSSSSNSISINPINSGGQYRISVGLITSTYFNKTSILRNLPDNWATLNPLTYYEDASYKNTWYMIPSTWVENGETVIQSVGYSHSGKALALSHDSNTTYYSIYAPEESDFQKTTGELFLGSYVNNSGNLVRTDGIDISSRPVYLSFDYKYEPYNNEKGEAYISILDSQNDVLSSQRVNLDSRAEMGNKVVMLPSYKFGKKAAKIEVSFKSTATGTTPSIYIPSGEELEEPDIKWSNFTSSNTRITQNAYKAKAVGSKLTVDNVVLGYDPAGPAQAPARKKANKRR